MIGPRTPLLPRLQYHLSTLSSHNYGWITLAGEKVHRVGDQDEFYRALGYAEEVREAGLLPDEFVWERYIRESAVKSAQCLQVQIAAYLRKHSVKFGEEFGHIFESMIGNCISGDIDNSDAHCVDCPIHPRFAY